MEHSQKKSKRSGQSLVEAIVALSILTTGFVGILTLLTKSFQLDRNTADQTKATYLAAEGIELSKNLIDHDVYLGIRTKDAPGGWGSCFNFSSGFHYYEMDYTAVNCVEDSKLGDIYKESANPLGDVLYVSTSTGLYGYKKDGATKTNFVRNIKINRTTLEQYDVQSTVTWNSYPLIQQTITLEDQFYNWNPSSN